MIRHSISGLRGPLALALGLAVALAAAPSPAFAQTAATPAKKPDKAKPDPKAAKKPDPKAAKKPDPKAAKKSDPKAAKKPDANAGKKPDPKAAKKPDAPDAGGAGKPLLVANAGDWGAYTAGAGKARTCYALAKPKDRQPATLKRDPGYLFISTRPGESVKNEVSFVMGFELKPDGKATAEIGSESFDLIPKGSNLWLQNPAREPQFVDALRKGQRLVVKSLSKKGNASTDSFVLAGLGQMLDRVNKDCQ